jgi:hypothetical protein
MHRPPLAAPAVVFALALASTSCGDNATGPTTTTGAIEVTLTMSGVDLDPDGVMIYLDGLQEGRRLMADVPLTFFDLPAGKHSLWVDDLSGNCGLQNNPRPVTVGPGDTAQTTFDATCSGPAPTLDVSQLGLGMIPGAWDTVTVRATSDSGADETWTATSSDPSIAAIAVSGNQLTVTGVGYGQATIRVTSKSGVERDIPVQIYDPKELNVGDLLLAYTDSFTLRGWNDENLPIDTWWQPVPPPGWKALGSLEAVNYGGNANGKYWAIVVKENGASGALDSPTGFIEEGHWNTAGGDASVSLWTPICPSGYVALGTVAGTRPNNTFAAPDTSDVACVRANLAANGQVDPNTGYYHAGGNGGYGWNISVPDGVSGSKAYLAAGTFVFQGGQYSCAPARPTIACGDPPYSHPVMHVLAVTLPMLVNTPEESRIPSLTSYDQPPVESPPTATKTMLVPFTAVAGGTAFGGSDLRWMVDSAPFVQVERDVYNRLMFHTINTTSVVQQNDLQFTSGVETAESQTFSQSMGISVSYEVGVSFMGFGSKTTITASYSFGYESTHSVSSLRQQTIDISVFTAPGKAAAAWQQRNLFRVKRYRGTDLEVIGELEFGIDTYVVDEYPN